MNEQLTPSSPPSGARAAARSSDAPAAALDQTGSIAARDARRAFGRLAGVAAGLGALIAVTYLVPPLHPLRPYVPGGEYVPFWNLVGREWMGEGALLEAEAAELAELERRTRDPLPPASTPVQRPVKPTPPKPVFPHYVSPSETQIPQHGIEPLDALDHFFLKLTMADLGTEGSIARAGHWGDSVLGVDGITSGIRRRLQRRFGDAGHGFHMMDRYNPSYRQQGIEFEPGGGWNRCLIVFECSKRDRRYGYGGLIAQSNGGGASIWSTPKQGFGQTASRFELWFAHQERGGNFEIVIDRTDKVVVPTAGPHLEDGWHTVNVEPGAHSFMVRAAGGGSVRAYGVVLENDGPGVVWDGMALIGGSTRGLRTHDPEHIASQIRHRDLDLLVFMFGGNDMPRIYVDLKQSMQPYYDEFGDVLRLFRAGKPEAACLIMSVTDHGERTADDRIVSKPFGKQLANAQREVARQNGCGFFDTYEATGGEGTAARWFRARPQLMAPDFGHPTGAGHEVIAGLVANALLHGYDQYRARMQGKPLPPYVLSRLSAGRVPATAETDPEPTLEAAP